MSRSVADPLRGSALPAARAASRAASLVPTREAPVIPPASRLGRLSCPSARPCAKDLIERFGPVEG